jgi:hypothetical protein
MKEQKMNGNEIVRMQAVGVQAFDRVSARCEGLVAVSWLAGEDRTFDEKLRRFGDVVRPTALVLEVTQYGGLTLSVAIVKPQGGTPVFETLGKWDFRAPISPRGKKSQMNLNRLKHRLNAKRACDMLHVISDFGYADRRGEAPKLSTARWPQVWVPFYTGREVVDRDRLTALALRTAPESLLEMQCSRLYDELVRPNGDTTLVAAVIADPEDVADAVRRDRALEDFSPVLGALDRNPFVGVDNLVISFPNPAGKILSRRGIVEIDNHTSQTVVDEIAAEIRSTMPDIEISESEVADAILDTDAPLRVAVDVKTAVNDMPDTAASILRYQASKRAQREATDQELFTALADPSKPLVMHRLSTIQVNDIAAWQNMPRPYAGDLLAPIDWQPAYRFNTAPVEETTVEVV